MKLRNFFILLVLFLGMTSCTPDDEGQHDTPVHATGDELDDPVDPDDEG